MRSLESLEKRKRFRLFDHPQRVQYLSSSVSRVRPRPLLLFSDIRVHRHSESGGRWEKRQNPTQMCKKLNARGAPWKIISFSLLASGKTASSSAISCDFNGEHNENHQGVICRGVCVRAGVPEQMIINGARRLPSIIFTRTARCSDLSLLSPKANIQEIFPREDFATKISIHQPVTSKL